MFSTKTVFILGAGASWHYGYPTGETLIKEVIRKAKMLETFCKKSAVGNKHPLNFNLPDFFNVPNNSEMVGGCKAAWLNYAKELNNLYSKLEQVHPLVIDYFLEQNPTISDIGKFIIAWVILECEARNKLNTHNANRIGNNSERGKDNWYRFILSCLTSNAIKSIDLHRNNVHFVTFNYDISLETSIYNGLSNTDIFTEEDINKFIQNSVSHVYGQISTDFKNRNNPFALGPRKDHDNHSINEYIWYKSLFEVAHRSAGNIRTINGEEKEDKDILDLSRRVISQSQTIYLLGYGFDTTNNRRLDLSNELIEEYHQKRVFFTNFEDSNIINKRASHIFWGHNDDKKSFVPPNPTTHGQYRRPPYFEKSTRTVYEAFEKDFDLQS